MPVDACVCRVWQELVTKCMCFSIVSRVTGQVASKSMGGLPGANSLTVKTQAKSAVTSCQLKAFLLDRIAHDPTTLRDVCVLPQNMASREHNV